VSQAGSEGQEHLQQVGCALAALETKRQNKVLKSADWPSFVATVRPIYEDNELENLFANCTPEEEMRFKFYLMSGFRDGEGRFLTWRDIDFRHNAVRVTAKPHWGFHPKNWDEREVPVPQKLISLLEKFRPKGAGPDDPVFPSLTGRPDGDMLDKLKRRCLARQAELRPLRHGPKAGGRERENQSLRRWSVLQAVVSP
jgi:integrase